AEVNTAHAVIINNLLGMPRGEHRAFVDDVGAVADAEGLAHVMIGDQHADRAFLEEPDDALNVEHGDRVDAGERLVEQDEGRLGGEGARDLEAAALAARKRDRSMRAQMRDVEVLEQLDQARLDLAWLESLQFEDGLHVFLHRETPEHRILLRQIGDAQPRAAMDRQVRELGGVEVDGAGVDRYQPDAHVQTGGLAGAVGAELSYHLAAGASGRRV